MEFPALVTISYGGYSGISSTSPLIIDSWTRVTSYLCIIHVDDGFSKAFKNGLEDAVKSNDAKKVQEQEMMLTDFNLSMVEDDDSSDEEGGVGQCDGKKI